MAEKGGMHFSGRKFVYLLEVLNIPQFFIVKWKRKNISSFIFIVPSAAVFFSWLLMDETIELKTIIGGTTAIFAVFIINGKLKVFGEKSPD